MFRAFLSWCAVLAIVAGLGWYGLGWLAEEVRLGSGGDPADQPLLAAPVGGLYWLITVLLPGYVQFRYPAKLLVVAAAALSVLSAQGWDRALADKSGRWQRVLLGLGAVSLLGAVAALAIRPFWNGWMAGVDPDVLFGPLDATAAANDLLLSMLHAAAVCIAGWWLLRRAAAGVRWASALALVLVAVDLGVANRWMVVCAREEDGRDCLLPAGAQAPPGPAARKGLPASTRGAEDRWGEVPESYCRTWRRRNWMPASWSSSSRPTRLEEAFKWDRNTLRPKYNLPWRIPMAEVHSVVTPYDYEVFLSAGRPRQSSHPRGLSEDAKRAAATVLATSNIVKSVRGHSDQGERVLGGGAEAPIGRRPRRPVQKAPAAISPAVLDALGVRYVILSEGESLPQGRPGESPLEDARVWTNPRHMPRAWIAEQVEVLPPLGRRDPAEPGRRTDLVLFPQGCPRDLRRSSVVETGAELPRAASTSGDRPPTDEGASSGTASADPPAPQWCRLLHYDPLRVEIEAHLARPGLVVLCDQFYLGWQLEIQTAGCASRRLPILRTNRVMRGAWLPAGRHLLCYRYRPGSFFWGALASGIGWFALGTLWIAATAGRCLRRRRRKPSRP